LGIIPYWICAAPIWVLPEHFKLLESCGVRKVVALSSTSRFTKDQSSDSEEQMLAKKLADAEDRFEKWASAIGIDWIILRPTLIYGYDRDKNISEIVRFIHRFNFFPLFGKANGLRQPIHCDDVAKACVSALLTPHIKNRSYNISGGETLTYREMVSRIFIALGHQPRFLTVPLWVFRLSVSLIRIIPRYRKWNTSMAERMNIDLVFDHTDATCELGFNPKRFASLKTDLIDKIGRAHV
jgi:nucleoside-diphosphate-sugar epimerase